MKIPAEYGDFSALEDLAEIFESSAVLVQYGVYGDDKPEPGPHVLLSAPTVRRSFDVIRREDGSFILRVR